MIKVSHLNYEYPGKRALKDVSFTVAKGSVTALVGPNGAGKTTLLRCVAGIDEPFSGRIQVAGIDVTEDPRRVHRVLGYLSDFFGLYNDLTVRQCLTFAAWLHALPNRTVDYQVTKTAEMLELSPLLSDKVKTLSRGWRQRLGIAQSIIHEPKLLLLDEPASGLDPEARVALSALFRNLQKQGMTLLISSHILAELEDYCTDMLVLRAGKIAEHRSAAAGGGLGTTMRITFVRDAAKYLAPIKTIPGVSTAILEGQTIRFHFSGDENAQHNLLKQLIEQGAMVREFNANFDRLQDIYLALGDSGKPGGKTGHAPKS